MLWTAVAESTHNHVNKTESAACSICVVAHSTAPAPSSHQAKPFFAALGLLPEEDFVARAWLSVLDLGNRGPPAVLGIPEAY
jgi:hypothetical protein